MFKVNKKVDVVSINKFIFGNWKIFFVISLDIG